MEKNGFNLRIDALETAFELRINALSTRMDDHFSGCRELCLTRLKAVDISTEKAHERLDKQKTAIECLTAHKNREVGFRKAISVVIGVISVLVGILTYLDLRKL